MVESISISKSIASIMSENDRKVTVVTLSQSPDLDINHFGFKRFDVLHGAQWPPDSKNETQSSLKCGFLGSVSLPMHPVQVHVQKEDCVQGLFWETSQGQA